MSDTIAFHSARPELKVDGRPGRLLDANLLSLQVEESTAGLYTCSLVVNNWGPKAGKPDYLFLDRKLLDFGKSLSVNAGVEKAAGTLFEGKIMGIEAQYPEEDPPRLMVLADDRLQDLRMVRKTRSFADMSDRSIMEDIIREHSLTPAVDVSGPDIPAVAQVNQSDLAFLRQRALAVDAQLWLEGNTVHIQSRSKRTGSKVKLVYHERLLSAVITVDLANQRTSLVMGGWDFNAKQEIRVEAGADAIRPELQGGQSGAEILKKALGERAECIVHKTPFTVSEGTALAEGHFRMQARRFLSGTALAEGDARIRVGSWVELAGLGKMLDGEYFVTDVCHVFNIEEGFRTRFAVERPWLGKV